MPKVRGLTREQRERTRLDDCDKRRSEIIYQLKRRSRETNEDLAKVIGISSVCICNRAKNRSPWTVRELILIADHYNVDDTTRAALLGGGRCKWEVG